MKEKFMQEDKKEEIPLSKLLEAITPYQAGIYVTVLNIIQCIALAFLINEVKEAAIKGELDLILIMRSAVALTIILVIWHRYVCESQYLWPMSWWDTAIPFSIGLTECIIVFLTNAKVPLKYFILGILIAQVLAFLAYWHAYRKRKMEITEDLYYDFYSSNHRLAYYLLSFLTIYDERNRNRFAINSILSAIFLVIIIACPFFLYELIFPAFYIAELVRGEILGSFHRSLSKDFFLRDHFTRR